MKRLLLALLLIILLPTVAVAELEVRFLNIGEGDAAMVTCDGETMIIDGGPGSETSMIYTIVHSTVEHVKYLVATHPHEDHVGGLSGVLNAVPVDLLMSPVLEWDTQVFKNMVKYAEIDLSTLTVEELDGLSAHIENEKRKATEVSGNVKRLLEADFRKAIEEINPNGTTFSYPFFGLSIVHRQYYYCVCGTVGCHFPDKTNKDLWDATIIYWHDRELDTYNRAAFYTRDEVFFVDEAALSHVIPYAEKVALDNIKRHKIPTEEVITRNASVEMPLPIHSLVYP